MNKRIAVVLASAASFIVVPAALAAPVEPASGADHELTAAGDAVLDHGEDGHDDGKKGDEGEEGHDHDGDGRPDHDPEDHDEDEGSKTPDDDE